VGLGGYGVGESVTPNPEPRNPLPSGVLLGRTVIEPLRRLPSQLAVIDDLLDGGLPRGRVSELVGPLSSGKTSLLIAFLAAATRRSEVTAYVDLADSLHPESFAAAGVDLERLLWVRPPSLKDAAHCAEIILQAGGFAVVALDLSGRPSVIGDRSIGRSSLERPNGERSRRKTPSAALWPRLMRAAEQSHAALIVLTPRRLTGSVAAMGIEMKARPLWNVQSSVFHCTPSPAHSRERAGVRVWSLFDGFEVSLTVVRNKLGPPGRRSWLVARHSSLADRDPISP
jgi:hypothetical protein